MAFQTSLMYILLSIATPSEIKMFSTMFVISSLLCKCHLFTVMSKKSRKRYSFVKMG